MKPALNVFEAEDYRHVVKAKLKLLRSEKPRGAVGRLAKHIRCHPTFFSQVTMEKANFSTEQGLAFCEFVGFNSSETEFFLDLLHRDRAADSRARDHYETRLIRRRQEQSELKHRFKEAMVLSETHQQSYFRSWLPQAMHMLCRLPGGHTAASIASQLGIGVATAQKELDQLVELGLLQRRGSHHATTDSFLHLHADSPLTPNFHASWRTKVAALITEEAENGFHYSGALTLSRESALTLRRLIVDHMAAYRKVVESAADEELHVLTVDFCPLIKA